MITIKDVFMDALLADGPILSLSWLIKHGVRNFEEFGLDWQIKCAEHEGLVLLNYTNECNYKPVSEWKPQERVSRGLIFDSSGNVIACPFEKFFNAGQESAQPGDKIENVTEKMDGSLGILYRDGDQRLSDSYRIATRGSFTSDQALWATEFLSFFDLSDLRTDLTLLFEIIYPENRVVIDYEGYEGLVLLGAVNRRTGEDFSWDFVKRIGNEFGFPTPENFKNSSLKSVIARAEKLSANEEGFVVRYKSGLRLKVKGEEYLKMHRFISEFSMKRVAQSVRDNNTQEAFEVCPEHYRKDFIAYAAGVNDRLGYLRGRSMGAFQMARDYAIRDQAALDDQRLYRKRFAEVVMRDYKDVAQYAFALLDKREIDPMIFNNEWGVQ